MPVRLLEKFGVTTEKPSRDEWGTPFDFYRKLNEEFKFTLDPCTSKDNPLGTPKFYTIEDDGLQQDWRDERVFCNPPYSAVREWAKKCRFSGAELVVLLIPVVGTGTKWFHRYCVHENIRIRFNKGRLKFRPPSEFQGKPTSAPFDTMLVIFKNVPSNSLQQGE